VYAACDAGENAAHATRHSESDFSICGFMSAHLRFVAIRVVTHPVVHSL
jgi:hypothetical protein